MGRLAIELFVVFAGVYAAFLLSRYQEDQRDDARRTAIYQALLAEVDRTAGFAEWYRSLLIDEHIEPFVEPYRAGGQPPVYGLWLPGGQLSGTWDAMLESGVDLLDPAFIQSVESHRATVQFMIDETDRAVRLSDEQIVPRMGEGGFYGASGRLRPPFRWYPQRLGYLVGNADRVVASTDSLRAEILRRMDAG